MSIQDAEPFSKVLHPSEKFLWIGKPRQGFKFDSLDIVKTLRNLVNGVALLILALFLFSYDNIYAKGFAIFSGFIAVYAPFKHCIDDRNRRLETNYAITNNRIITRLGKRKPVFKDINFDRIRDIQLKERRNGLGDVMITKAHSYNEKCDLIYIENAEQIYNLIQNARNYNNQQ